MAQVNVTISGKNYRMACEDGQEEHLDDLATQLNQTIDRLRGEFGEIGDQRLTVMAAITMADQSQETGQRVKDLEKTIADMEKSNTEFHERQHAHEVAIARSIDTVAQRIEVLAGRLAETREKENGG